MSKHDIRESGTIEARVRRCRSGTGGVVVVEARAESTTRAYLDDTAASARAHGLTVYAGTLHPLDTAVPLAGIHRLRRAGGEPLVSLGAGPSADLHHHASAITRVVRGCSGGVAVVLDNVHLVDEQSAWLVGMLGELARDTALLVTLGHRSLRFGSAGEGVVHQLVSTGAEQVDLGRTGSLSLGQPDAYLTVSRALREAIAERVGGNQEIFAAIMADAAAGHDLGWLLDQVPGTSEASPAAKAVVERGLRGLPPRTRWVMGALTVLGDGARLHAIADLLGISTHDAMTQLDPALADGWIVADGDGFSLRHTVLARLVYASLPAPWRSAMHRQVAESDRPDGWSRLPVEFHRLNGGDMAVSHLDTMIQRAHAMPPGHGAALLLQARARAGVATATRARLSAAAGRFLTLDGRHAEALSVSQSELRTNVPAEIRAELRISIAEAYKHSGDNAAAAHQVEVARSEDEPDLAARALLSAIQAHAALCLDDLETASVSARAACSLGEEADAAEAVTYGLAALSALERRLGDLVASYDTARQAVDLADRSGEVARHRHPRLWLGRTCTTLDRMQQAADCLDTGRVQAIELGSKWSLPLWDTYSAELQLARGQLQMADQTARVALQRDPRQLAPALLATRLSVAVARGDDVLADEIVGRLSAMLQGGVSVAAADVTAQVALHTARHDVRKAAAELAPFVRIFASNPALVLPDQTLVPQAVSVLLSAGHAAAAETLAAAASTVGVRHPQVVTLRAVAHHCRALMTGKRAVMERAVEIYRQGPRPLATGQALRDLARLAYEEGDTEAGDAALREARGLFVACAAHGLVAAVDTRAEKSGQADGPPGDRWQEVSEAELRVVRLVAYGMTNREVASKLHLSPHTVDSHLRHVYTKLGVRSRVAMVTMFLEDGEHVMNHEKTG